MADDKHARSSSGGPDESASPDTYPDDAYAEEVIAGVGSEAGEPVEVPVPMVDEIDRRAYDLWIEAGRPASGPDAFREQVEQEMTGAAAPAGEETEFPSDEA